MSVQPVTVNVQTGAGEIIRIVGTVLLCGSVGLVGFALAEAGWLEIASSGITMFLSMLVRLMFSQGLLAVPKGSGDGFAGSKGVIQTVSADYTAWLARSTTFKLSLVALGYAIAFLVARQGVSVMLTVFSNMWIAAAATAAVAGLIVAPKLIPNVVAGLRAKGVVTTTPAPSAPAPSAPAPAPAAQAAPRPVKRVYRQPNIEGGNNA
ncbi:hypothetical protein ABH922_001797 [Rhodococcus sp. 27YEA15]|uniref:hypothetical protein n=1 Tax=Rhodococcus sp. 27YEA15 TaxID=3156259 RepID=UPI003C7DF413